MEPSNTREMRPEQRRARALIRDEHRLRKVLADHEAQRFDLATAASVRDRTEDLLETLQAMAADEEFWNQLQAGYPISEEYDRTLSNIDAHAFELLLEACGYRAPPPPTAGELVDETLNELAAALESQSGARPSPAAVSQARRGLILTIWRVRRQIQAPNPTPATPSRLRSAARTAGRAARRLIPLAVAGAAGAIVEIHAPATGVGVVISKSAQKVTEDLIEVGATWLMVDRFGAEAAERSQDGSTRQVIRGLPEGAVGEVLQAHLAALADALREEADRDRPRFSEEAVREPVAHARRHAERIIELLTDHGISIARFDLAVELLDRSFSHPRYYWREVDSLRNFEHIVSEDLAQLGSRDYCPFGRR